MTDRVLAQIASLAKASLADLKTQWRDLLGTVPPGINRDYLERRIAYRLQELAYGGLSTKTRARLDILAKTAKKGSSPRTRMRAQNRPIAGTRLIREWQGVEYSVTVMQTGFDYQGRPYASLSAIARQITGTRWNGPAFFGLRAERP
jgi:hypothetical protein